MLPVAICDNSKEKQGTALEGIPIISFDTALEKYTDLKVLVTSVLYGNEIEKQVLEQISSDQVLNIKPYLEFSPTFVPITSKLLETYESYISQLQSGFTTTFSLKSPTDVPDSALKLQKRINKYQKMVVNNQTTTLPVDNYLICQEYDIFECPPVGETKEVDLNTFLNKTSHNGILKANGSLYKHELSTISPKAAGIPEKVNRVCQFHHYLAKLDTPFLYVQLPCKIDPNGCTLPEGYHDQSNKAATDFLKGLSSKNIEIFDYREFMLENKIDFNESFFRTDNHWKISTAFSANTEICKRIEEILGGDFDYSKFDLDNYQITLYKKIFLGAWGKLTGILYGGLDDFELILPKYDTDYTWTAAHKGYHKRGSAKEALLYTPLLNWEHYRTSTYGLYSLIHCGTAQIINHKNPKGPKILILNDSFSNPLASFMAPHFSELVFIDVRGELSKQDVFSKIDEMKPDIVLMMNTTFTIAQINAMTDLNPYTK